MSNSEQEPVRICRYGKQQSDGSIKMSENKKIHPYPPMSVIASLSGGRASAYWNGAAWGLYSFQKEGDYQHTNEASCPCCSFTPLEDCEEWEGAPTKEEIDDAIQKALKSHADEYQGGNFFVDTSEVVDE